MKTHRLSRIISVMIKYTYLRGGIFYYQRPIPDDLKSRYGKSSEKRSLKTSNPERAVKAVERLNALLEAEWERLRFDDDATPASLKSRARVLLSDWGLHPKGQGRNNPDAIAEFHSHVESGSFADADERPLDHIGPVEQKALEMLHEGLKPSLDDALDFYLANHKKGGDIRFQKLPRIAVRQFVACVGDKALADITRDDVRFWMAWCVEKGQSGGTIDRRLNSLSAIATKFIREKELDIPNRFEKHEIPQGAKAEEKRESFSDDELALLQKACIEGDDDLWWLIGIMSDTCSRLAEIAGLRVADIFLDSPIPYIKIEPHPGRALKTKASERVIPLVGAALWAAQRVKGNATKNQIYAFPRYMKTGEVNGTSASAAVNKRIRSLGLSHVNHEFRHTMKDRLRDVECLKELQDQIGGWSRPDESESYGLGYRLGLMHKYLIKTVLPSVVIPPA